jgi:NAD(P)-dependent dehydrogenase (short-subunit alcohol dehydrogenase family)
MLPSFGITPIIGFHKNQLYAKNLSRECGGFAVNINMSSEDSMEKAIHKIASNLKDEDTLIGVVLAASPPPDLGSFFSINSEQFLSQFQVNVIGTHFLVARLIKNFFRKEKVGKIVGILSKAIGDEHESPATGMGAYVVAKAAFKSMLAVCAVEYPWLEVRTVSPSFTQTDMLKVFDTRYLEMMSAQSKISNPEDVAKLIIQEIIS